MRMGIIHPAFMLSLPPPAIAPPSPPHARATHMYVRRSLVPQHQQQQQQL
jgi:hypothetical protein